MSELVFQVLESVRDRDVVPLGSAFPRLRLNCGHEWSPAFDAAVRKLGDILRTPVRATA